MPSYSFLNEKTGEYVYNNLKTTELKQFKVDNPDLVQVIGSAPNTISGTSMDGGKLPEGFKDVLRNIKKKHPGAGGVDNLV